jgi:polar amino acid transport system substrate-binding protein
MNLFMRLITSFSIMLLLTFNSAYAVEGAPVLTRIQESGKLVVGTSGTMPLMSEKLMTGEVTGFDVDMAKALAETMGVKLELKPMPFDQLVPALESGKVDVVISNMTMTVERNMRVAFAGPYFVSGKCLVTKEQDIAKADEPDDLKETDTSIAVVKDTTSENFVKELLPQTQRVAVDNVDKGINMVSKGEVNAFLTDFPICLSVMKRFPDSGFHSVVSLLTYEPIGIALPANDPLLLNLAENFIERAEQVGLLQGLGVKWFGEAKLTLIEEKQTGK